MPYALLILSGDQEQRKKLADEVVREATGITAPKKNSHPDINIIEAENSIGIDQIRLLQQFLFLKPYSAPIKVAIITQAEKLTIAAQNALLKTLEEPPANSMIILLSPRKEALLPTIISRCQLVRLQQKSQIEPNQLLITKEQGFLIKILNFRAGERIKLAAEFSQRQKAQSLVENFIYYWREFLLFRTGVKKERYTPEIRSLSTIEIRKAILNTEKTRIMIEANVNPLLAIENLFLTYPHLGYK